MFSNQHYQHEADGLCTKLVEAKEKAGRLDFSVDSESFEKGMHVDAVINAIFAEQCHQKATLMSIW